MKHWTSFAAAIVVSAAAFAQAGNADGEVTKIDKAAARVTIKHGGLPALEMPPMTQTFRVAETKLLDSVAVGDRVRFTVEKVSGGYTVKVLNRAP
jgi:Cu(I)/Ag(I) efflux system protein CusF